MTCEVVLTPSANADVFEINAWLLENSFDSADRWLWELSRAVTSLNKFPNRCPISEESAVFDVEVRELLFGSRRIIYRILFTVKESKVFVLRVRSTRQRRLIDNVEDE